MKKFLSLFNWDKYNEARKGAMHASQKADQASRNAHQLGTPKAHLDAVRALRKK